MRVLGLDTGDKTIGVAISDAFGWTAQGLETIVRKDTASDIKRITELARKWGAHKIVVGFPKNMDSSIGPQGEKAMDFAEELREVSGLEVVLWDERLSTVAAEKMLIKGEVRRKKRKEVIDKVAASLILQGYLDSLNTVKGSDHGC